MIAEIDIICAKVLIKFAAAGPDLHKDHYLSYLCWTMPLEGWHRPDVYLRCKAAQYEHDPTGTLGLGKVIDGLLGKNT